MPIHIPGYWICGMCQKIHETEDEATNCSCRTPIEAPREWLLTTVDSIRKVGVIVTKDEKQIEKIDSAAVKWDGNILTGRDHAEGFKKFSELSSFRANGDPVCGFVTDTGRFVTRAEAFEIAVSAGQIADDSHASRLLVSEDLRRGKK